MEFVCERCGETENVKHFSLFGEGEPGGEEILCWNCRFPYIRQRVDGKELQPEPKPEPTNGQTGLADYI